MAPVGAPIRTNRMSGEALRLWFIAVTLFACTIQTMLPHGVYVFPLLALFYLNRRLLNFNTPIHLGHLIILGSSCLFLLPLFWTDLSIWAYLAPEIFSIAYFGMMLFVKFNPFELLKKIEESIFWALPVWIAIYSAGIAKFALIETGAIIPIFDNRFDEMIWGSSLVTDYNMYALGVSVGVFLMIHCLSTMELTIWRRRWLQAGITLGIVNILLSGSRRGVLVLLLILITILYDSKTRKALIYKIIPVAVLLVFLLGSTMYGWSSLGPLFDRYMAAFSSGSGLSTGLDPRTVRWKLGIGIISKSNNLHILLGAGFDYLKTFSRTLGSGVAFDYPHSPLISAWLYGGLPALGVLIIWYIVYIQRLVYWGFLEFNIATMGLGILLVSSISGNSVFDNYLFVFWSIVIFKSCKSAKGLVVRGVNLIQGSEPGASRARWATFDTPPGKK